MAKELVRLIHGGGIVARRFSFANEKEEARNRCSRTWIIRALRNRKIHGQFKWQLLCIIR